MLNVIISMTNENLEVLEARKVQIINGVEQVKDHLLDCMYSLLDSRSIVSKTFDTFEGNPVLCVEMKDGETFTIGGNMTEAEDDNEIVSNPFASVAGTSKIGEIRATYEELYKAFGNPVESGCDKISTEWKLEYKGSVYTIYDYKQTNLYDHRLPSVRAFRSDKKPKLWSIGGKKDETFFYSQLHKQLTK
jgi:hypothetical protein